MRAYLWSKKHQISDLKNIIAHWQESEESEALTNKCCSFQKQLGGLRWWEQCNLRKALQFNPHLILETVFAAFKLPEFLHNEYGLPYPPHICGLKDSPHDLTKYEGKETSKIPNSQLS